MLTSFVAILIPKGSDDSDTPPKGGGYGRHTGRYKGGLYENTVLRIPDVDTVETFLQCSHRVWNGKHFIWTFIIHPHKKKKNQSKITSLGKRKSKLDSESGALEIFYKQCDKNVRQDNLVDLT